MIQSVDSNQYRSNSFSKVCEECGKSSPKGLRFDLDLPIPERKWKCDKCYFHK